MTSVSELSAGLDIFTSEGALMMMGTPVLKYVGECRLHMSEASYRKRFA
jgi:hypothetical protein